MRDPRPNQFSARRLASHANGSQAKSRQSLHMTMPEESWAMALARLQAFGSAQCSLAMIQGGWGAQRRGGGRNLPSECFHSRVASNLDITQKRDQRKQ